MSFEKLDAKRNQFMLTGSFKRKGYDWWWHSFTAVSESTGEERPFFIEFFAVNPARGADKPVFGQLKENKDKGIRPSYVMVKAGSWGDNKAQLHRYFAWNEVNINTKTPYSLEAGDCYSSDTALKGSVNITKEEADSHPEYMCDAGEMSWDLKLDKKVAFNVGYGASGLFRAIKAFEMYWHAQGMKTLYDGYVIYNGEKYIVKPENSYGYADKNWGRGFTSPWVWLSSNNCVSRITGKKLNDTVFDIGGGRPKIYFLPLDRKLLGAIWHEGKGYEFNFSKFWTGSTTEFECHETEDEIVWHVKQGNRKAVMITDITCKKKDMLWVNYEAPDGSKRHNRLWNGGNGVGRIQLFEKKGRELKLIDDIDVRNIGCEYGEYDK